MRRGLLHVGVWAVATAVAVAVSWFGVRSVLRSTAYGPPRTVPIAVVSSGPPPGISSAVHRPKPSAHPTAPAGGTAGTRPPSAPASPAPSSRTPSSSPSPSSAGDPGDVHSYTVAGGQVVLDLGATSASLVSATPQPGWRMQLWTDQPGWLRVTFTSANGSAASSVICTWNGHPPTVQAYED
ncbi:hypothetical protein SAMN05216223_111136 [Actinacidiphila yanglinensis]|uniref:Secreted protein n=1 Tax=Actinacidiphila yanglinensis TaxID=310779 RepID=A0A1H6D2T3_9ACTN|nr:hypothetical protein [Actinacidiphila yanglinensis]SEG79354.1 hypothetical protein SAMN05216223_111136 [Actinacidiphila yanglinensis]